MPKTFETPFAPKEEPKSPEQIKEEQGLALAEEINKIKKRITEQGGTIEDYQRIIELTQRIKEIFEEKEGDYEAIAKTIVTNLEKALKQGAGKDYVAWGLAGVAGKEAMELRERLLKQGAGKNYVALGLAGVAGKEAMELRERLLEQGADKDYVARGLAGVNTKEAEEFRRKHFGNEPNLMAKSYSTGLIVLDGVICRYGMVSVA